MNTISHPTLVAGPSTLSGIQAVAESGDLVAQCGQGVFKKSDYRVVFNLELSDDGYSIFCNEENGDMGDRFLDAFDETGFAGHRFLADFADLALDVDDLDYAQDLFADRMRVIQYLKDGGFIGEQYDFVLIDKRIVSAQIASTGEMS